MAVRNNYFSALTALVVGGVGSAIYALLAHYIPLMVVGLLVPMALGCFVVFFAYAALKGSTVFRFLVSLIGIVVNAAVIWFIYTWLVMNLASAVYIFSSGPVVVFHNILFFAENFEYGFGQVTSGEPDVKVTGTTLLVFWAVEQAVFVGVVILAFFAASNNQHVSHQESLAESSAQMKSGVAPALGMVLFGVFKGFVQLAVVAGLVLLALEIFG